MFLVVHPVVTFCRGSRALCSSTGTGVLLEPWWAHLPPASTLPHGGHFQVSWSCSWNSHAGRLRAQ